MSKFGFRPNTRRRHGGARRTSWARGLLNPKTIVGIAILVFFVGVAVIGPALDHTNPSTLSMASLRPPSGAHWLGTTQTGQDVLSQLLRGTRVSLLVGLLSAALATSLSLVIGLTGGYLGGFTDEVLSALSNIFLVIPALPLVIVLAGYLPSKGSLGVGIVVAVTGWAWGARVLRAQTLSLRKRDFVEAARATGETTFRLIFFEILPNEIAVIASGFLFTVIFAILTQASLAFLGLSDISTWSWGTMLYWAQNNEALQVGAWWWFVPPGLCIALCGMGLSLVNFGIDEFINPRLRAARVATKAAGRALRHDATAPTRTPGTEGRRPSGDPSFTPVAPGAARVREVTTSDPDVVLEVRGLSVDYGSGPGAVHAVHDVTLTLRRGEVLGIAGESGSGKSTLAFAMHRLLSPPGGITAGEVIYQPRDGAAVDILRLDDRQLRQLRWSEIAMVFQSAMNALNPVLSLRAQIDDVLAAHRPQMSRAERHGRTLELLRLVGISADRISAYPHELSGGQRQRAMIAIALALDPEVVIMDEPTTALDVVMQRQILSEISSLRDRLGFSVVFITHDLSLLVEVADRIAVMYSGRVVELATSRDLYRSARHPYSHGLLRSFPRLTGPRVELTGIAGSPPDLREVPGGCAFHPRCPHARQLCESREPAMTAEQRTGAGGDHQVACLLYDDDGIGPPPADLSTDNDEVL